MARLQPDLGLATQALWLKRLFPGAHIRLSRDRLVWQADLRPADGCETHSLRLDARTRTPPRIYVTAPELVVDHNGCLPHVYGDGSLCVADVGDWRPDVLYVDSVIPWAMEWLVYYELWCATGVWYGDGPERLDPVSQAALLHPYRSAQAWSREGRGNRRRGGRRNR